MRCRWRVKAGSSHSERLVRSFRLEDFKNGDPELVKIPSKRWHEPEDPELPGQEKGSSD